MKIQRKTAFSLVEILVALTIMVLALAPLIPKFSAIKGQSLNARNWVIACSIAANKLEELKMVEEITPQVMQTEKKNVNNTEFDMIPTYERILQPAGFENSTPKMTAIKFKVIVKWSTPGTRDLKLEMFFESLVFKPMAS